MSIASPVRVALFASVLAAAAPVASRPPAAAPVAHRPPAAAPRPPAGSAAPAPPNGTYTYILSRNGGDQGTTTVVIYRRAAAREIETDEAGGAGAARIEAFGSYRYSDLGLESYTATYQAPFLRDSAIGRAYKYRLVPDFYGQTTVRYRAQPGSLIATIDGTPVSDTFGIPAGAERQVANPWLLDGPFMTGALLLPAFRHRTGEGLLAPASEAFPSGLATAGQRLVRAAPTFATTPKTDLAVDVPGVVRVWFDPATYVVHEVHFSAVNFDARLVSYVRGGDPAGFLPQPSPQPEPVLPREAATFASADGTSLAGLLSRPPDADKAVPAIVLVPPGPGAGTAYGGEGPYPMYPELALALEQRGYAVLRYDMRGIGKSGGSSASETWDQALADVEAAFGFLADDANVDPKRIYLLGYGNGADLALAAKVTGDDRVAGIVALAPTVLSYRNCAAAVDAAPAENRVDAPGPRNGAVGSAPKSRVWERSVVGHDPAVLAARAAAPLLVLHPGIPVCGETKDQIDAYDDALRAANPLATIVAATDLTARFGGRYEAEAPVDTEEFFPYRFDASTAAAIADWLDNPKTAPPADATRGAAGSTPVKPPPPPPGVDTSGSGLPNPHRSTSPASAQGIQPGVVLPNGATPPPQIAPAASPTAIPPALASPTPVPTPAAIPAGAAPAAPTSSPPAGTPTAAPPTAAPPAAAPTAAPPGPVPSSPSVSTTAQATAAPATATPVPATSAPATATPAPAAATTTTPPYAATSPPAAVPTPTISPPP